MCVWCVCVCIEGSFCLQLFCLWISLLVLKQTLNTHTHSQCITSAFHLFVSALAKRKTREKDSLSRFCCFNVWVLVYPLNRDCHWHFIFKIWTLFFSLGWSDWCLSLVLDDINELLMDQIHSSRLNSVFSRSLSLSLSKRVNAQAPLKPSSCTIQTRKRERQSMNNTGWFEKHMFSGHVQL